MNESRHDDGPGLSDADLEMLLKRRLRDPRRERVLQNVLAAVGEARPAVERAPTAPPRLGRWWRRWPGIAVAAGAVSLSAAVVVLEGRPGGDGWRSRGGSERATSSGSFDVVCTGGPLARCPAGSTLIFRAQGATTGGYLSAYADPLAPGGQRIWYFSNLALPVTGSGTAPVTLRSGIRVGPEHVPGVYRLHIVVSTQPLSRGEPAPTPEIVAAEQTEHLVVVSP